MKVDLGSDGWPVDYSDKRLAIWGFLLWYGLTHKDELDNLIKWLDEKDGRDE